MTESIQKKLLRVRPPRVRITYDVETGGAIEKRELPFIVGILADLTGDWGGAQPTSIKERRMIDIDRDKFNDVMKTSKPGVSLTAVAKPGTALGSILKTPEDKRLQFQTLEDFEPLRIVERLPSLNALYKARGQIRGLQARIEADDEISKLVDQWVLGADPEMADNAAKVIKLRDEVIKALGTNSGADKSAHKQAVMALFGKLGAAEATDDEVAELRAWGLFAKGDAKPDEKAVAGARARARKIIAALQEENTQANRILAQRLLTKQQAGAEAGLSEEEKKKQEEEQAKALAAALAPLGADADQFSADLAKLDNADQSAALWPKALLLLGLNMPVEPAEVKAAGNADPKALQDAILAADARGRVLDFVAYLRANPAGEFDVADQIFRLIEKAEPDEPGKTLLRLHYFTTEVLSRLQNQDDEQNASLRQNAKRGGAAAAIDERVAQIDTLLSTALSGVMHSEGFQRMEATWRGLGYLVFNTETGAMLKLRVFNATKEELLKDMEKAVEFDQSTLFKLIYEKEYGSYGGTPYSLLVGDYRIGSQQTDINFLKKISEVAAAAHAPFIAAASEQLFGLPSFATLDKPRDLKKIFESEDMAGWREFREMEDARYVSLVLPRVLLRLPYGRPEKRNTIQCEGLNFEEQVTDNPVTQPAGSYPDPRNANFLWGNPAYVLAERITHAFALYSWTAAIRGVEGGGLVEGLPLYTYTSDSGMTELFCPTEVAITDRREKELNDLGFISLCHCKGTGKAAFFGGQTTNQPKKYFSDDANANAKISAMLPYILAASRFAHYIKVIMRDKIGSFLTRANVETYLNTWIANYVLLDDNATQEVKSSYPLRSASVVVTEAPGEPGAYRATVFLKPHFQLEELTTSIRLVANLPK
ncbi:MAG TPA: type VI secretion system contractile sheath large subunit [Paucimonas sp.]|nr:type VI secretion system contractile sheath large subunit [Paucimonas sp.]